MRLIGQLPHAAARTFADALFLRGIEVELADAPPRRAVAGPVEIWGLDEDRIAEARALYSRFLTMPTAPEFRDAARQASERRAESESRAAAEARDLSRRAAPALAAFRTVAPRLTFALMGVAVAMAVSFHFHPSLKAGFAADGAALLARPPQLWRLLAPAFLCPDFWHLLLMLFWFHDFGSPLERAMGHLRFAGLLAVLALATGTAQNLLSPGLLAFPGQALLFPSAWLGLGGMVYGMWGYHWGRSLREPGFTLPVNPYSPILLGIYFLLGLAGLQGDLPLGAYVAGFAIGMVLGLARRRR